MIFSCVTWSDQSRDFNITIEEIKADKEKIFSLQYYGCSSFQHPTRNTEMDRLLRRYSPLQIFRLCYVYLLYFHPSDYNIVTQYSHNIKVSSEHKTCYLVPWNHTCTLTLTIAEAPPCQIFPGHPSLQPFYRNVHIGEHWNHHRWTTSGPWTYQSSVPCPCSLPL